MYARRRWGAAATMPNMTAIYSGLWSPLLSWRRIDTPLPEIATSVAKTTLRGFGVRHTNAVQQRLKPLIVAQPVIVRVDAEADERLCTALVRALEPTSARGPSRRAPSRVGKPQRRDALGVTNRPAAGSVAKAKRHE
jgi:hypothetical protein